MKQTITYRCPECRKSSDIHPEQGNFACSHCGKNGGRIDNVAAIFDQCPVCQCRHFYLSKDFNQALGLLILAVGIVLVPRTYGLSLPLFALIDWILYKRIPTIVHCYQCGALSRGFDAPKHLKVFDHHLGLRYDKFRK